VLPSPTYSSNPSAGWSIGLAYPDYKPPVQEDRADFGKPQGGMHQPIDPALDPYIDWDTPSD